MRILLPIDGSHCTSSTVEWATQTYAADKVVFYLLFVVALLPDLDTAKVDMDYAISVLKERAQWLEKRGFAVQNADYAIGEPADEICKYASQIAADEIVIGSHGRTGLNKFLLGSVSSQVLEHCLCPVTIHHEVKKP